MFNFNRQFNKSLADLESNAPVGSSASTNDGFVAIALHTAPLCFCPPETSPGYLSNIDSIFNSFEISFILFSITDTLSFLKKEATLYFLLL